MKYDVSYEVNNAQYSAITRTSRLYQAEYFMKTRRVAVNGAASSDDLLPPVPTGEVILS